MGDNNNPEQVIFKVVLKDKNIVFQRHSDHIPTLDHIVNQLHYDIIELRAIAKTKKELNKPIMTMKDTPITKPQTPPVHGAIKPPAEPNL